jgi:hypothetical protein
MISARLPVIVSAVAITVGGLLADVHARQGDAGERCAGGAEQADG